jgi:biopolymer transport protein ExbB
MWDFIGKGGPFMWPIITCSMVALAIILERWVRFVRLPSGTRRLASEVADLVRLGRVEDASRTCDGARGPVATVLREYCGALVLSAEQREQVAHMAGSRELRVLEQRLRALAAIARISPLLGLLGTVVGLVEAFMVVADHGGHVEASLLAGGIWQALLTTVAGLIVAIPATLFHDWFEGKVDDVAFALTEAVTEVGKQLPGGREGYRVSAGEDDNDGVPTEATAHAVARAYAAD